MFDGGTPSMVFSQWVMKSCTSSLETLALALLIGLAILRVRSGCRPRNRSTHLGVGRLSVNLGFTWPFLSMYDFTKWRRSEDVTGKPHDAKTFSLSTIILSSSMDSSAGLPSLSPWAPVALSWREDFGTSNFLAASLTVIFFYFTAATAALKFSSLYIFFFMPVLAFLGLAFALVLAIIL